MDPSSRKRGLESEEEGRDDDKKRHASDESPLAEPSFAKWEPSESESELEDFLVATDLYASNFPPQTTELELMSFFGSAGASIDEEEIIIPVAKPEEKKPEEKKPEEKKPEEKKSEVKTKKVAKIWFESRQAKKEAFKRNGEKMNGVPIYLTRVTNNRIVLLVEDLDTVKSESDIKAQLRRHFGVCGNVYKIFIPKNDTGGCLSFGYVFLIQKKAKVGDMENLCEMDGREIKVSDCTFKARFRVIKAKMEAEGWVNSEVPEDEDSEDEGDGLFGNYGGNIFDDEDEDEGLALGNEDDDEDEDEDEGLAFGNDEDEEDDEMDSEED